MTQAFQIRFAVPGDEATILRFICALADYEHLRHEVVATEALLHEWLFEKSTAEVFIAELDGTPVGYSLFFHNFSTFLGRAGIYLEDLFILPEYRGRGFGKAMLQKLAQLTLERGCGRLEWACLDWNLPSIEFYLGLNARPMEDWTTYRLTGDTLRALAESNE